MPWKNFDYIHYLKNHQLQKSQLLQPVFEAVQNALQSVEDCDNTDGLVEIFIHRSLDQQTLDFPDAGERVGTAPEFESMEIVDSGLGFNDENWTAYETISTSHRQREGGKGMGRLLYCVPFGKVHFESVFQHDSSLMKREFSQGRQKRGTSKAVFTRAFLCERVRTKIIFDKPNTDFKGSFLKDARSAARRRQFSLVRSCANACVPKSSLTSQTRTLRGVFLSRRTLLPGGSLDTFLSDFHFKKKAQSLSLTRGLAIALMLSNCVEKNLC